MQPLLAPRAVAGYYSPSLSMAFNRFSSFWFSYPMCGEWLLFPVPFYGFYFPTLPPEDFGASPFCPIIILI